MMTIARRRGILLPSTGPVPTRLTRASFTCWSLVGAPCQHVANANQDMACFANAQEDTPTSGMARSRSLPGSRGHYGIRRPGNGGQEVGSSNLPGPTGLFEVAGAAYQAHVEATSCSTPARRVFGSAAELISTVTLILEWASLRATTFDWLRVSQGQSRASAAIHLRLGARLGRHAIRSGSHTECASETLGASDSHTGA